MNIIRTAVEDLVVFDLCVDWDKIQVSLQTKLKVINRTHGRFSRRSG
jgi:hypothetical protein